MGDSPAVVPCTKFHSGTSDLSPNLQTHISPVPCRYDSEEEEDEKIAPSINELEQETADLAMQLFIKEAEESFLNAWAEGLTFEELSAYEQALSGLPFPKTVKRLQRCINSTRRYFSYIPLLGRYVSGPAKVSSVPVSESAQASKFNHL